MANNCWNWVCINGDKKTLDKIEKKFKKYDNTNWFVEFGDKVLETRSRKSYENQDFDFYYKYGTKWWDFELQRDSDTKLYITGDTAWSPPQKLLILMSKKYKLKIYHEFDEPGCDFAGKWKYTNGVESGKNTTYQYGRWADDYTSWIDEIFEYMDDDGSEDFEEFKKNYICSSILDAMTSIQLKELKDEYSKVKGVSV